eukprot:6923868-Pyramimonas_sp.AAC.1
MRYVHKNGCQSTNEFVTAARSQLLYSADERDEAADVSLQSPMVTLVAAVHVEHLVVPVLHALHPDPYEEVT